MSLHAHRWTLSALLLVSVLTLWTVASSCKPNRGNVSDARRDEAFTPAHKQELDVVLIGDTGKPGPALDQLRDALKREKDKDVIIVLGDLAYPVGPTCPHGRADSAVRHFLDKRLGKVFSDLGVPVLLALGNHDTNGRQLSPAREACLLDYAATHDDLVLPSLSYSVDYGVALLGIINTNVLSASDGARVAQEFKTHKGWRLLFGHHVLKTYHDKASEDYVRPWLAEHAIKPDLYGNGHAHLLQFGVYDGIPALTSGATAKLRQRKSCPPDCGPGQLWGSSTRGYAVLSLNKDSLKVVFKDLPGDVLWRWSTTHPR